MLTLIAFEFKKLFSSKAMWATLALTLLLIGNGMKYPINSRINGAVQGMRDAVAPFEGKVLTDSVANQAQALLLHYIEIHPDSFSQLDNQNSSDITLPVPINSNEYAWGYWTILSHLAQGNTVEKKQANTQLLQEHLDSGVFENGHKLTDADRQSDLMQIEDNNHPVVIRYAAGWEELPFALQGVLGMSLFALLLIGLTALFANEHSTRMDCVLLSTKHHRQAIGAKVAVSIIYAVVLCTLLLGASLASIALTYGLDGGQYTIRELKDIYWNLTYGNPYNSMPVSAPYLPAFTLSILAAAACAALIALASSLFRHPMAMLGAALAVIAVQFLPAIVSQNGISITDSASISMIPTNMQMLSASMPAYQLINLTNITTPIVNGAPIWQFAVAPALLGIAAAITTPLVFCRRRKV